MIGKFDIRGIRPVSRNFARNAGAAIAAIALIGASSSAMAQSSELPSGTVSLHIVQAGFVGGGSKGHGVLHFQGRNYPFTTAGAGIGGFGVSRFDASGAVYNLKSVGDFAGPYGRIRTGLALGDVGKGKMLLRNANGVTVRLSGVRKGLALAAGADAMVVSFPH